MRVGSERRLWVDEATHSVHLEGLQVSVEYIVASEDYAAGGISADELVRMTRARFGLI